MDASLLLRILQLDQVARPTIAIARALVRIVWGFGYFGLWNLIRVERDGCLSVRNTNQVGWRLLLLCVILGHV